MIKGGTATYGTFKIRPNKRPNLSQEERKVLDDDIYTYKHNEFLYVQVGNAESRNLIKNAILPLDLKWKLDGCYGYECGIIISWDHWSQ